MKVQVELELPLRRGGNFAVSKAVALVFSRFSTPSG